MLHRPHRLPVVLVASGAAETRPLPLTAEQETWYQAVAAKLDADRFKRLLVDLVNIHSPTGGERAASEFLTDVMTQAGLRSAYQPISDLTGNATAELRGSGGGARLLLYAPVDTHIDPESDEPFAARKLRADMLPVAKVDGDLVIGLGASNPKCMVAALIEVAHALAESGVPIKGDLLLGFAGGGMPAYAPQRNHFGMSSGVFHLLNHGMSPDFAIIMKPWFHVFSEEPGMAWFKISVDVGSFGYAGIPRGIPTFRSSILPLTDLLREIDDWILGYIERNSSGYTATEGWISGITSGKVEKPAFPAGVTEVFFDVRVNPRTPPGEVIAQFAEGFQAIQARHPELRLDWDCYGSVAGGMTDPENWIIQSARRGWERVAGRPHGEPPKLGGQTDGALIRRMGVPCARIGYPWPPASTPPEYAEGLGGMGVASVKDVMSSTYAILYSVIDTLTRDRAELGL